MPSQMHYASLLILIHFKFVVGAYNGASFPVKYLLPEEVVPTETDMELYSMGMKRVLHHMTKTTLNQSDPNQAISLYFMRAILKRTLLDNGKKIKDQYYTDIKSILKAADNLMSHFFGVLRKLDWSDMIKRVAEVFRDDSVQVRTIGKFNANRMTKFILRTEKINTYGQVMDEASLPKEKYVELVELQEPDIKSKNRVLTMDDSDYCLSKIVSNPMPWDMKMQPCKASKLCAKIVYRSPSTAYITSHRMLNVVLPRQNRRCYMRTRDKDYNLLNALCASMYRETVYLARRGYFYRDLFMEHIAFCSLMGYKEFHRRHWFRKIASWIDEDGCIQENMNFLINRSTYVLQKTKSKKKRRKLRSRYKMFFKKKCHPHQMALSLVALAHGIRHAAYFSVV